MTENQRFEQLVQRVAPGGRLVRAWPLQGGISAGMTALEVEHPNGQTSRMIVRRPGDAALKRNPRAAHDEYRLLQLTHFLGLATPTPYDLDQSGAIFPTPYLVIEYIVGQPEYAPADVGDFTIQLATQLARIHGVDGSKLDGSFLPKRASGCAETSAKRPASVDASLEEGRIRDRLEAIGPLRQRNAPALLHGDYWPGNLLWRDATLVAVIDWEDAAFGDPLLDLAVSRLDILWIFGADAMDSFTDHYRALMAIDYSNLPYWDLCAALRLVRLAGADLAGWAAFFGPFGRHDITEHTIRDHYRSFIAQAFERLGSR